MSRLAKLLLNIYGGGGVGECLKAKQIICVFTIFQLQDWRRGGTREQSVIFWPWMFWANPALLTAHCKVNCCSSYEVYLIWSCSPLTLLPLRKTTVLSVMLQATRTANTFQVPQHIPVWAQIHVPTHTSALLKPIPLKVHESVCSKCEYINTFIHTQMQTHKNF